MGRTLNSILRLEVPIIVRLADRQMKLSDIASLTPGSIIELPKRADEELDLLVNNVPIAQGEAVKVSENFGIGITFIGDVTARIEALGGHQPASSSAPDDEEIDDATAAMLAEQFLNG
ncbi:MAG: FliM/FliN family flagellar motor switch protein [Phycisphaerales bacterium]